MQGEVTISVFDTQGKQITSGTFRLQTGKHTAVLPAMPKGTYIASLKGKGINESVRWTSVGSGTGGAVSTPVETGRAPSLQTPQPQFQLKNRNADDIVEMLYADDELLRLTGVYENHTTIIMKRATVSHEVEFYFIECKDGAGIHYPIVKIGNHYWMTESLKAPAVGVSKRTSATHWNESAYNTPMYAYYDYSDGNQQMGAFFNYQGAINSMPDGWRMPTSGEIDAMLKVLGGYNPAGEILKGKGSGYFWRNTSSTLDETTFCAKAIGKLNYTIGGQTFPVVYYVVRP